MMTAIPQPSDNRVYLELAFHPTVVLTTAVRRFVSNFYQQLLGDLDATSRLAMAAQELLENAVKYTSHGETMLRIELDGAAGIVRIHTSNRSDAAHIAILERLIGEMRAAPDPFAFYQGLLRSTMHDVEGSGLGLARIRCEGDMQVDLSIDGDLVAVTAWAHTEPRVSS
ncbi:MAG TPA: hypothetical protein VEK07_07535 [Polyangiaceae bacterium]|nr:hypothetical protein [Polyangiaceae bacterium]